MHSAKAATLASLQVGLPATYSAEGTASTAKPWTTGSFKLPQHEPVWLGSLNLAGDGQADLRHHGGPDKAVCVYSADHYPFWRQELDLAQFPYGAFGENFTVDGLAEFNVCIGDIWTIGNATIQVSQPRQPCWKLARRWGIKDFALRVQQSGRTGWYCRVLAEGFVASGMPLLLSKRLQADWSVEKANHLMHYDKANLEQSAQLASVPELSSNWQNTLRKRVEQRVHPDDQLRLQGNE